VPVNAWFGNAHDQGAARLSRQPRQLEIVTYAEPGAYGRLEQYLVMPGG
jgi:hypothetical protein